MKEGQLFAIKTTTSTQSDMESNQLNEPFLAKHSDDPEMPQQQRPSKRSTVGFYWAQFRKRQVLAKEGRTTKTPFFSPDQEDAFSSQEEKSCSNPWKTLVTAILFGCFVFLVFLLIRGGLQST